MLRLRGSLLMMGCVCECVCVRDTQGITFDENSVHLCTPLPIYDVYAPITSRWLVSEKADRVV